MPISGDREPDASELGGSTALIRRFSDTERAVHWTYAICFLLLMATGLIMELPFLSVLVPNRDVIRQLHYAAAFFFVVGPPLVALLGDRQTIAGAAAEIDVWDDDDRNWIGDIWNGFSTRAGRFNAGQKLNAIFTVGAFVLFVVTGLIMLSNVFGRLFPLWLVSNAIFVHDSLTWFALAAWFGHVFLACVYPPTRPALRGMLTGLVRRSWAREHHPKWYEAVTGEREPEPRRPLG